MDFLTLAKHNQTKVQKGAGNTMVDPKKLGALAKKNTTKAKDASVKELERLTTNSLYNQKVCVETPGLIGKVDYIRWVDEEKKIFKNTITGKHHTLIAPGLIATEE